MSYKCNQCGEDALTTAHVCKQAVSSTSSSTKIIDSLQGCQSCDKLRTENERLINLCNKMAEEVEKATDLQDSMNVKFAGYAILQARLEEIYNDFPFLEVSKQELEVKI